MITAKLKLGMYSGKNWKEMWKNNLFYFKMVESFKFHFHFFIYFKRHGIGCVVWTMTYSEKCILYPLLGYTHTLMYVNCISLYCHYKIHNFLHCNISKIGMHVTIDGILN